MGIEEESLLKDIAQNVPPEIERRFRRDYVDRVTNLVMQAWKDDPDGFKQKHWPRLSDLEFTEDQELRAADARIAAEGRAALERYIDTVGETHAMEDFRTRGLFGVLDPFEAGYTELDKPLPKRTR